MGFHPLKDITHPLAHRHPHLSPGPIPLRREQFWRQRLRKAANKLFQAWLSKCGKRRPQWRCPVDWGTWEKLLGHLVQPAQFVTLKVSPASSAWGRWSVKGRREAGMKNICLETKLQLIASVDTPGGRWQGGWLSPVVWPESLPPPLDTVI